MMQTPFKRWAGDIRFWITLFFVLRLFGITNPPLEVAHNWRQTTVTMVARNFLETDNNILYPRIDFAGDKSGITGMEFPVLNYLIYLCSLVFGYAHWYGRLINLVISSFGIYYFYLLVKRYFSTGIAFKAAYILLLSVWFTYSRKIMPDTFSMSLLIMGFYYGTCYLDGQKTARNLLLYTLLTLVGALSKLPAAYILVLFSLLLFRKQGNAQAKFVFAGLSAFIALIVSAYYFYWAPYLTEHFGFYHFFLGTSAAEGFEQTLQLLNMTLQKFYEEALGFSGFVIFIAGLVTVIYKKEKLLLAVFALAFFGFIMVVFKAGATFSRHSYYIVPFAPVMALIAAAALQHINNQKLVKLVLMLFTIEAIASKNNDFYIKEENLALMQLEEKLDGIGTRNDLIVINSGLVPTPVYFAHRKGWIESNENLQKTGVVAAMREKGLKFIVILKRSNGSDLLLPYQQVLDDENFRIYKL